MAKQKGVQILPAASSTQAGFVSLLAQSFAGLKTFLAGVQISLNGPTITSGTGPPVSGVWIQGSVVLNTAAAIGQPTRWICTVGGNPGTWIVESVLQDPSTTFVIEG